MKFFIAGISGTGMGPLALMAKAAGLEVVGSDLHAGAILPELLKAGIEVKIGPQDGEFLKEQIETSANEQTAGDDNIRAGSSRPNNGIWFVHTSALPENHPEVKLAREMGLKITKRDELTAFLVKKLQLKMVAVAGTHGKTTTTSMLVYAALKLGLPAAYIVGTTLGFAPSGAYHEHNRYFIYEADEYDRNFLKFHPWTTLITCATYDHPDIYRTRAEYQAAFQQFKSQSEKVVEVGDVARDGQDEGNQDRGGQDRENGVSLGNLESDSVSPEFKESDFTLAGEARRKDAALAATGILLMAKDAGRLATQEGAKDASKLVVRGGAKDAGRLITRAEIVETLNTFPGVGRRFERIADGIYSDYAHHPEEITATLKVAEDECRMKGKKGVIAIYEPHQNTRQHEVCAGYKNAFWGATKIFWLPTYLTREDETLSVLTPTDLIKTLANPEIAEPAELNDELAHQIKHYQAEGYLVLLMTAGPADAWLRNIRKTPTFFPQKT